MNKNFGGYEPACKWCSMEKSVFVLKNITDFAAGAFENTTVEGGGVRLGRRGSSFLPSGSYTTQPFAAPAFTRLLPSWNADTPPGTTVEMEVRVAVRGQWSHWFPFGKWSPFIERRSPEVSCDEVACMKDDALSLAVSGTAAELAQARIFLATEDEHLTPKVGLLAVAVDAAPEEEDAPHPSLRTLAVPAYSCLVRDPAIAHFCGGATSVSMLLNRWGEDVLPEEIAHTVYDSGTGRYSNINFLCAAAGMYGYECYSAFAGVPRLMREIWAGRSVASLVAYRAPHLGGEGDEENTGENSTPVQAPGIAGTAAAQKNGGLPVLSGAHVTSAGHFLVLHGFVQREDGIHAQVHDPMSPSDAATAREIPLDVFTRIYRGVSIFLRKGEKGAGTAKPLRVPGQLALQNGTISLSAGGETLVPGRLSTEERHHTTLCYTLALDAVFPTAAQRQFYYPHPGEDGTLQFDPTPNTGKRFIFYAVGGLGRTWVGEQNLKKNC